MHKNRWSYSDFLNNDEIAKQKLWRVDKMPITTFKRKSWFPRQVPRSNGGRFLKSAIRRDKQGKYDDWFSKYKLYYNSIFFTIEQNQIQSLVTSYQKLLKITLWLHFWLQELLVCKINSKLCSKTDIHQLWERSDQVLNLVLFDSKKNIAVSINYIARSVYLGLPKIYSIFCAFRLRKIVLC